MASPKSIAIAATQITQIMKDVASSQYGGQTANRADEHLAQYAKKDYEKFLEEARETIPDGMPVEFARRQVESAKKNEPAKLHFGSVNRCRWTPRSTPTLTNLSKSVKSSPRFVPARPSMMPCRPWNTRSTRTVCPTARPRSSLSAFGLGTDWFAREVQRAILLNRIRGLGKERHTAIFPKLVVTVKHGVNADRGDPNYDLKQLALECATKRMYPDVVFYDNIVKITGSFKAPMGCRSFLQGWIDPETGKDVEGRPHEPRRRDRERAAHRTRIPWRQARAFLEDLRRAHGGGAPGPAVPHHALQASHAGERPDAVPLRCVSAAWRPTRTSTSCSRTSVPPCRSATSACAEATAVFYGKDWMRDHGMGSGRQGLRAVHRAAA